MSEIEVDLSSPAIRDDARDAIRDTVPVTSRIIAAWARETPEHPPTFEGLVEHVGGVREIIEIDQSTGVGWVEWRGES